MTSMAPLSTRPVVLCILDGWGLRGESENNAIMMAKTPNWDRLVGDVPLSRLETSGLAVGLPDGQMGNSEVGHMNLGSGRVVMQTLPRIDSCIANGELPDIPAFKEYITRLKATGGTCHMMGLLSPGGVHSHQDHMVALARVLADQNIPVAFHAFLDGRDVPPQSALEFVEKFEKDIAPLPECRIATLCGRYYAMDRDKRWDRVEKAYHAMVSAVGNTAPDSATAIQNSYQNDITDEFVLPTVIGQYHGMKEGDAILMANFRADRAREILTALVDPAFDGFTTDNNPVFCAQMGMVEYSADLSRFLTTLFPAEKITQTLGEIVSSKQLKQLRIAETEKYAHVTFFFNGGAEDVYDGEDRILVPSPDVATYDLQPEMSAPEVTDKLVAAIQSNKYDLLVVNYANPDMVGHTGVLPAAIRAVETIDDCLGRLEEAITQSGGAMLVTADHGNIEQMRDPQSGQPHTAHTTNLVPFALVNGPDGSHLEDGRLADVAPTILQLLGISQPPEMSGIPLLTRPSQQTRATA